MCRWREASYSASLTSMSSRLGLAVMSRRTRLVCALRALGLYLDEPLARECKRERPLVCDGARLPPPCPRVNIPQVKLDGRYVPGRVRRLCLYPVQVVQDPYCPPPEAVMVMPFSPRWQTGLSLCRTSRSRRTRSRGKPRICLLRLDAPYLACGKGPVGENGHYHQQGYPERRVNPKRPAEPAVDPGLS